MNLKNILLGLGIFGSGVAAGYILAKKKLQQQYQDEIAEVKDFYYEKLKESGVMGRDFEPDHTEYEGVSEEEVREAFQRVTRQGFNSSYFDDDRIIPISKVERPKGRPIFNYNKPPLEDILSELNEEGDIEYDDELPDEDYEAEIEARAEEFAKRRYENQISGKPYCIDYDEWEDLPEEYDKQYLFYYSEDRVLCEDDDSIVEEEEELVGFDYEDVLSMQTTAWVRNDTLMIGYEICRIDDSYNRSVANAIETPKEREYRLLARQKRLMDNR